MDKNFSENIIELKGIRKCFEDGFTAVEDFNLSVKKGEFVTFLGPSGCGKTTTLRMIAGFDIPTEGQILLNGKDISKLPPNKRPINTVFQRYALFPHLNIYDNIAFGLKLKTKEVKYQNETGETVTRYEKFTKEEIKEKVKHALEVVDLEGFEKRRISTLSGGQQQRIAIARAIVNEPEILLLDEPLGALDLKMRKEMQLELKAMHKELGITFIYVTHDQEEALTMSDKVVVMSDGMIQQIGTPEEIYNEPNTVFVADFIGESNILSGVMVKDFAVKFLGTLFECEDKGFGKNEPVDLVVRPEDIKIYSADSGKGQLSGKVLTAVFKGTWYEMEVEANGYEFTVQSTTEAKPGATVRLGIKPDGIHIMKKLRTINEFKGEVSGENTVDICGGTFEFDNKEGLEKGTAVKVSIGFDGVELTDDENDGVIGAFVTQTLYKGTYYQVQIYTDTDEDFYIDTTDEWDIGDRVGVKLDPAKIKAEPLAEEADNEEN